MRVYACVWVNQMLGFVHMKFEVLIRNLTEMQS